MCLSGKGMTARHRCSLVVQDALLCSACTQQLAACSRQSPCSKLLCSLLDTLFCRPTAGVLSIESQAERTIVLARAWGAIAQATTCRLAAVLVTAVTCRVRSLGGGTHFEALHPPVHR